LGLGPKQYCAVTETWSLRHSQAQSRIPREREWPEKIHVG